MHRAGVQRNVSRISHPLNVTVPQSDCEPTHGQLTAAPAALPRPQSPPPRRPNSAGRRPCTPARGPCPWLVANTPAGSFIAPFFPATSTVTVGAVGGPYAGAGAFVILPDAHALAPSRAAYRARGCVQVSSRLPPNSSRCRRKRSPRECRPAPSPWGPSGTHGCVEHVCRGHRRRALFARGAVDLERRREPRGAPARRPTRPPRPIFVARRCCRCPHAVRAVAAVPHYRGRALGAGEL